MTFVLDANRIKAHQYRLMELISKRSLGPCKDFLMKNKYPAQEGMGLYVMALIELAAIISRDYCKNDQKAFQLICEMKAARIFAPSDRELSQIEEMTKELLSKLPKQ